MKRSDLSVIAFLLCTFFCCSTPAGRDVAVDRLHNDNTEKTVPAEKSSVTDRTKSIQSMKENDLPEGVIATWESSGNVYYLRVGDGGRQTVVAGRVNAALREEMVIPHGKNGASVRRFFVIADAYYILWNTDTLFRASVTTGAIDSRKGVFDAFPVHGSLVLAGAENGNVYFECNGSRIPLTIAGAPRITSVTDDRIVFISNGSQTEVIDAPVPRSLYMYPADGSVSTDAHPENVRITARDDAAPGTKIDDGKMVFFMIYADGVEAGRTPTGPASLSLNFSLRLEPGAYHIIRLERWELDRVKQRYERANNVNQPDPVSLYVPLNRVVTVDCRYDGRIYSINAGSLR